MRLELNGKHSFSERTRHLNIRYFYITDQLDQGWLTAQHCRTEDMISNFFTKPLQSELFRRLRALVMNCSIGIPPEYPPPQIVTHVDAGVCWGDSDQTISTIRRRGHDIGSSGGRRARQTGTRNDPGMEHGRRADRGARCGGACRARAGTCHTTYCHIDIGPEQMAGELPAIGQVNCRGRGKESAPPIHPFQFLML